MKILVIRFSSIGDIILTSPVVRCLRQQLDAEIHFLTKSRFGPLLRNNPHIDKLHLYETGSKFSFPGEKYDLIVDLHNNLRSRRFSLISGAKRVTFKKLNIHKWLRVNTPIDILPEIHLIDRYFEALKKLGVRDDGEGLEFYLDNDSKDKALQITDQIGDYICLSLGANYFTKRIPLEKCREIINKSSFPVIIIGGHDTLHTADSLNKEFPGKVIDMCGKVNLQVSAGLIQRSRYIVTGDTGMMHIAAAFQKPIYVLWGNTIPAFGMYPYYGSNHQNKSVNLEVKELKCRPCSKLGFNQCPKGHFSCMMNIDITGIS